MTDKIIKVSIGVILNNHNELLIAQRPKNELMPVLWGLPGGKVEGQETTSDALHRELEEELGIKVTKFYPWIKQTYQKQKIKYDLFFYRVVEWDGTAYGREKQLITWANIDSITHKYNLLPTTFHVLRCFKIPNTYAITSINSKEHVKDFLNRLNIAINNGISLIQFREPNWNEGPFSDSLLAIMRKILSICKQHKVKLLINSVHPESWWAEANGVHLRSIDMKKYSHKPKFIKQNSLIGVSAHNSNDLEYAYSHINADFAVLGPVLPTLSHPNDPGIGWDNFKNEIMNSRIPVFSLGGQSEQNRETAYQNGAHGIAGIRFFI
ncbi:7,8-dihydro-8-oxoguanine triphosphatase [Candidatus Kinetoplastibacterium desouzaii TCC079E]|uniref:8-oxo-dGTP diphosphatase n=1 Tax=Candidatus Kinetoplastidibacterium desouzai TCC079E TaxID=1208919 RepID=M1LLJ5_9PROT|nr:Nudix family hydrolase [Candidatus Kinetoplastibacterium desouzaii]AGF46627.1 7,8-dihydro-8-oxoguanine triphosphatase [Candidatus Kinetoplastibacterium desouzaii TCC079E]